MPMILLAAGQFLQATRGAKVAKIHYGKQESKDRATVFELDGLTHLQAGVNALAIYDRSGDFEPLLRFLDPYLPGGMDRDELREAAFQERILRIPRARKAFQKLYRLLSETELAFPARLLQPELAERVAWANEPQHHRRQLIAARRALIHGDYLRTAALLYEGVINHKVYACQLGDAENRDVRERARDLLYDQARDRLPSFTLLNRVRNALLHAVRPQGADAQKLIDSRRELKTFLERVSHEIERYING